MYEASLKVRLCAHKQPPTQQPTITLSHALSLRVSLTLHAQLSPGVPNAYVSLASISKPPENAKLLKHALSLRQPMQTATRGLPTRSRPHHSAAQSLLHRSALMGHAATAIGASARLRVAATQLLRDGADDLTKAAELKSGAADQRCRIASADPWAYERVRGALCDGLTAAHQAVSDAASSSSSSSPAPAILEGRSMWRRAARALCTAGYFVLDGALSGSVAGALEREAHRLMPLMQPGRVGSGLEDHAVRTDVLWRHRRDEGQMVDANAKHMAALHALFDAIPAGLNALSTPPMEQQQALEVCSSDSGDGAGCDEATTTASDDGGSSVCSATWALTHAEDLQFACYRSGGYYKRHSDAQNATRRVLTAIYYVNSKWKPADGGQLRLYNHGERDNNGEPTPMVEVEPRADRLLIFDSRLDHEVLPMAEAKAGGGKKKKKGKQQQPAGNTRCAMTQWYQDLAPPLVQSALNEAAVTRDGLRV